MNNLINLPTINCITLKRLNERRSIFLDQCRKYNLNYNFIYGYENLKNPSGEAVEVEGPWLDSMNVGEISGVLSHIKAIKDWFFNSDDEYGFFCEDDLLLSINEYWSFNWDYVIENLPNGWLAVQLSLIRDLKNENVEDYIKLHPYLWDNWSACCYLISRKYAKIIIDSYVNGNNSYNLSLPFFPKTVPYIENVLYNASNKENIYTLPLFVENINVSSSFYPDFIEVKNKNSQKDSSDIVRGWWERNGSKIDLNWLFNKIIQDS
jgi:GR25 family glycosyltransferase involved in LPS biosynthesis